MCLFFVFFKQKTAYEMRISDWSSDGLFRSELGPEARRDIRSLRPDRPTAATGRSRIGYSPESALAIRGRLSTFCSSRTDRQSVVSGKSVSVRVDLGGSRIIKKNKMHTNVHA